MSNFKKSIYILIISILINIAAFAEITDSEYEKNIKEFPVYPLARIYDLKNYNIRMKIHITDDAFEKVSSYYVSKLQEKGWKIVFPAPEELKIWMQALYKDRSKSPVLILYLTKPKTKFNCNITIGLVKDARFSKDLTIITIYLTDAMLE